MDKKPLPQLTPRNLSNDYMNEITPILLMQDIAKEDPSFFNSPDFTPEAIARDYRIKPYTERFPLTKYDYSLTCEVFQLNQAANALNYGIQSKGFESPLISFYTNKIQELIRGKHLNK